MILLLNDGPNGDFITKLQYGLTNRPSHIAVRLPRSFTAKVESNITLFTTRNPLFPMSILFTAAQRTRAWSPPFARMLGSMCAYDGEQSIKSDKEKRNKSHKTSDSLSVSRKITQLPIKNRYILFTFAPT